MHIYVHNGLIAVRPPARLPAYTSPQHAVQAKLHLHLVTYEHGSAQIVFQELHT